MEVRTDDVDGVATFWVDTGRPTLQASLIFRYGFVDEPLHEAGWQHLLEHLALEDRAAGALHVNGSVSSLTTTFDFHGPNEAVATALTELTAWLRDPDLARVGHERNVLAAESAWRGSNPLSRALGWRFGALGPGVRSFDELGLTRATPELLAARAARVLTSGNATLVLDGPPPVGLHLTLPPGEILRPAPVQPLEPGPGAYGDAVATITGLVPRGHASIVAVEVLRSTLEKRLRHGAGRVYAVVGHYEQVSHDRAVLGVSAEAEDKNVAEVVQGLRNHVADLVARGCEQAALDDVFASTEQALRDPAGAVGHAYRAALRHLDGKPTETLESILQDIRAVTVDDVREILSQVDRTLLLGTPHPANASLPVLADHRRIDRGASSGGERWRSINAPNDRSLLVLHERVLEMHGGDFPMARSLDDLAAYVVMPHGYRSLIGRDGFVLALDPTAWRGGDRLIATLDAAIPEELHVPRALEEKPAPFTQQSVTRRWLGGLARGMATMNSFALAAMLVVGALVVIGATGGTLGFLAIRLLEQENEVLRRAAAYLSQANLPGK